MSGYISVYRKIKEHWIWDEKRKFSEFEAWIDLLMFARWDEEPDSVKVGQTIYTVNRGEQIRSMKTLSSTWNWNISKVRRFLSLLQKENMIRIKTDTQTTQITICNYDTYQNSRISNEHQMNNKRISNEFQMNTEEEYNKDNKENKKSIIVGNDSDESFSDEAIKLAEFLYESIISWDSNHKYANSKPSLKSWARDIDKAIRIDGRDATSLKRMIHFLFTSNNKVAIFWSSNIQSGSKLRKHYDTIKNQAITAKEQKTEKTINLYD
jgi:hypothetical protein